MKPTTVLVLSLLSLTSFGQFPEVLDYRSIKINGVSWGASESVFGVKRSIKSVLPFIGLDIRSLFRWSGALIASVFVVGSHPEPLAEFYAVGINNQRSIITLMADSTCVQRFEDGEYELKEHKRWKGSFARDSMLTIYQEILDEGILASATYQNINDTLFLKQWSIR